VILCSYIGNFIGGVISVMLFVWAVEIFNADPWATFLKHLAEKKCAINWGLLIIKGTQLFVDYHTNSA
jgi:formate/nitrite transporter FocA (FNT family)